MSLCPQVYIKTLHSHRLEVVYTDKFFDYFSHISPGKIRRSGATKIKISPFLKIKINVAYFLIFIIGLQHFWSGGFFN